MTRRQQLLALLLVAPALAGCGRRGDLRLPDRPAPPPLEDSGEDSDT